MTSGSVRPTSPILPGDSAKHIFSGKTLMRALGTCGLGGSLVVSLALVADDSKLTPETFDKVFSEVAQSQWIQSVFAEELPNDIDPFSFITMSGLEKIVRWLDLTPGALFVDLACGRGGPGLWLARSTGAELVGIDFSPVGIAHARQRAESRAHRVTTKYVVADAASTGLPAGGADGLVCVDAIQLMAERVEVMREVLRVLKPGARAVFTTWEEPDRLRDLAGLFEEAGLETVIVEERSQWLERERGIFERARVEAATNDDPALRSLAEEADRVLPVIDLARRVLGVARRPDDDSVART
jgi:ubiquinone/menaquinone biosynthesis C-methylase UbiE